MSNQTLACPQCHTALRSTKPLPAQQMVRCPHCGNHFPAGPATETAELAPLTLPTPPAPPRAAFSPVVLLGVALLASIFAVGGGIAAVVYLTRAPADNAAAQRLEAERQALAKEREQLEAKQRKLDFANYMSKGDEASEKKNYDAAVKAYDAALTLFPDDADARKKLVAATVALAVGHRTDDDKAKIQIQYAKLMDDGKKASEAKEWNDAVVAYQSAVQVVPGDAAANRGLEDARAALAAVQNDKTKLTDYQTHYDAGQAALKGQRYPDAVREFLAALRVLPNDDPATKGLAAAEKKLDDLRDGDKRKAEYSRLVERARSAYKDHHFDDAIDSAQTALKLIPGEAEAAGILASARQARTDAKTEYTRLIDKGTFALKSGQLEQAKGLFTDANRLFPDENAAKNGLRDVQQALDNAATFNNLMAQGAAAVNVLKYNDAVGFYEQAIVLNPNDVEALRELRRLRKLLEKDAANTIEFERQMAIGKAALDRRAYGEAAAAYRKAVDLSPANLTAIDLLHQSSYQVDMARGRAALNEKRYREAVRFYEDALLEIPGDTTATNQLTQARTLAKAMDDIVRPGGPARTAPKQ